MSFYIGPFYFDKRDLFLLFTVIIVLGTILLDYPLPLFKPYDLLILTILLLLTKGVVLPAYDSAVFVTFLTAIFLTLFFPFFKVLLFLVFAFIFLRLTKVI